MDISPNSLNQVDEAKKGLDEKSKLDQAKQSKKELNQDVDNTEEATDSQTNSEQEQQEEDTQDEDTLGEEIEELFERPAILEAKRSGGEKDKTTQRMDELNNKGYDDPSMWNYLKETAGSTPQAPGATKTSSLDEYFKEISKYYFIRGIYGK